MDPRLLLVVPCSALLLLAACSADETPAQNGAAVDPLAALDIRTTKAEEAGSVPLVTVPGQVTLPPEARVAVTAPYPGAVVRLFVIEGEAVRQGQPLALVRAAEPVQISGALARAQAELGLAEARARRMSELAREGIIAQARADEAEAGLRQARASLAENRHLAALGSVGADGMMTLRAPISGRVAHVAVQTGGPVDGMTAPFIIENPSAWQVDLQVPERFAQVVKPGMVVEVPLAGGDAASVTTKGVVLSVAPSIDPATRSVLVKARIDPAPGLVAGRNVMVSINGAATAQGVSVPSSAIARIGGEAHVFVRTGKTFVPRRIVLAAESAQNSVVSDGLKPGETVAVSGITELKAIAAE